MTPARPYNNGFAALSLTLLMAPAIATSGDTDLTSDEIAQLKETGVPQIAPPKVDLPQVNIPSSNVPVVNLPATDPPVIDVLDVPLPGVEFRESDRIALIRLSGDILFDFDKSDIRPEGAQTLSQVKTVLISRYPGARTTIHGHTDSKGSNAYNLTLSSARAEAVRDWLILNGVSAQNLTIMAHGERRPIAPNTHGDGSDNPQGRQLNRRVEIAVQLR